MNPLPSVALLWLAQYPSEIEQELASRLSLPLIAARALPGSNFEMYLRLDTEGLALYRNETKAPGAVRVDFCNARIFERSSDKLAKQNLGKAMGVKPGLRLSILDATAGLGTDAYLLASLGAQVHMLERSVIVHALLLDGIRRGLAAGFETAECIGRMQLHLADFMGVTDSLPAFDVIYLDPMFPPRKKGGRAKKAMNLMQQLLGEGNDQDAMLDKALAIARKRVVVKRARLSHYLADQKPDIEFKGSSNRYDVYLC